MEARGDIGLRQTPLEPEHRELGAKIGMFAGWAMPIEYRGTLAEHRAVREGAGLFDLMHLGKVTVEARSASGRHSAVGGATTQARQPLTAAVFSRDRWRAALTRRRHRYPTLLPVDRSGQPVHVDEVRRDRHPVGLPRRGGHHHGEVRWCQ